MRRQGKWGKERSGVGYGGGGGGWLRIGRVVMGGWSDNGVREDRMLLG